MKTLPDALNKIRIMLRELALLGILFSPLFFTASAQAATNLVVHEWGTFTSVQGADGKLLPWHAQQISELPNFVYNWSKPGMNRGALFYGKGSLTTLQRLETPVIYFYADQPTTVDVNVAFPSGFITEWYPQATQIGPTYPVNTNAATNGILRESRAIWRGLEILPQPKTRSWLSDGLPQDSSGSHYFAARQTEANLVRTGFLSPAKSESEIEKFIFYRGSGSFPTPLHVTINSNNLVTVQNTGAQSLKHPFFVSIHNGYGAFFEMDEELASSNNVALIRADFDSADSWHRYPIAQFPDAIGARMQAALIAQGLFPDEAKAMVNTWRDSWFTEEGVRVLYILPRAWTDETLPLTLTPQPKELTRVMVGRAEIITPDVETNLFQLVCKAKNGDAAARTQATVELKKLGRFAEPALYLASARFNNTNPQERFKFLAFADQLLTPSRSLFE